MGPTDIDAFVDRWAVESFSCLEKMFDFTKNPGIANGGSANHNAVYLVLRSPNGGFFY